MKIYVLAASLCLAAPALLAHEHTLTVEDVWARESAPTSKTGGVYATITNSGDVDDTLIAASADIADVTELHTHIKDGDVMRMRPVEGGIDVGAGESVSLAPGGLHVMLMGLKSPLTEGTTVPLTLTFEHAGEITVEVSVEDIAFEGHGGGHDHGHHEHGHDHSHN